MSAKQELGMWGGGGGEARDLSEGGGAGSLGPEERSQRGLDFEFSREPLT